MVAMLVIAEPHEDLLTPSTLKAVGAAVGSGAARVDVAVLGRNTKALARNAATVSGVDRVLCVDHEANWPCLAAIWAPQVAAVASGYTHVLAPANTFGKDLMPRIAALLGTGMLSDVTQFESPFRVRRPVYAGNAVVRIEADPGARLCLTIRPTAFDAPARTGAARIEPVSPECELPAHTRFVERRSGAAAGPDLQTAKRVVAGGRGVGGKAGFDEVERLARCLDAAVGASRAAVDAGWVSNELQVGQTGKIIAPELYFAIGISGAIQHLTGIKDAGTVVAINSDENAPICAEADISLVADLFDVLPRLAAALESRRSDD